MGRRRYRRWERRAAATLAEVDPVLAEQFLSYPSQDPAERLPAQNALLAAVVAGLQGGDAPLRFQSELDQIRAARRDAS